MTSTQQAVNPGPGSGTLHLHAGDEVWTHETVCWVMEGLGSCPRFLKIANLTEEYWGLGSG